VSSRNDASGPSAIGRLNPCNQVLKSSDALLHRAKCALKLRRGRARQRVAAEKTIRHREESCRYSLVAQGQDGNPRV
jgi:hypothetical protein